MLLKRLKDIYYNFALIFICFIYYIRFGDAKDEMNSPKSVLIVQRGQFGDMIVTTAMFRAVKKKYPNCKVSVIGSGLINQKVLEGNPDVDEYIIWNDDVLQMVNLLRKNKYDFGCVSGITLSTGKIMVWN